MVTPSLYRSFDRIKQNYAPFGTSLQSDSYSDELLWAEFLNIFYLFRINLLLIKKGTLLCVSPRYQGMYTLIVPANINLRS